MAHEGHTHSHSDHSHEHSHAPSAPVDGQTSVSCFVITVSDTRTDKDDIGGQTITTILSAHGHALLGHDRARDEKNEIVDALKHGIAHGARAIILTGGTGISRRDVTLEAIEPLLEKQLPGFGEMFRSLSFHEIGARALLSRASAGTIQGTLVFALPGSPHAVKLAMEKLIVPELGHFVRMVSK
jgi:molybdopterin adenylyltransferase